MSYCRLRVGGWVGGLSLLLSWYNMLERAMSKDKGGRG